MLPLSRWDSSMQHLKVKSKFNDNEEKGVLLISLPKGIYEHLSSKDIREATVTERLDSADSSSVCMAVPSWLTCNSEKKCSFCCRMHQWVQQVTNINRDWKERKHPTTVKCNVNFVPSPNASHFVIKEMDTYFKRVWWHKCQGTYSTYSLVQVVIILSQKITLKWRDMFLSSLILTCHKLLQT